jgi:multiple sugar transport system substrate-binding protein
LYNYTLNSRSSILPWNDKIYFRRKVVKIKKIVFALLLFIVAITVFAGGGKQQSGQTQASVTGITLWYYWETPKHQETLGRVIRDFNNSQDKITVTARYIPVADFKRQLSIGVTAAVLPDSVIIDGPDHASYAAMGIFADVTGMFDKSLYLDRKSVV